MLGTNLTEGPVFKKFVNFVIPIIATSILQLVYNISDTAVVGKFAGDAALAAVGSTGNMAALLINLLLGLSVGANVVCARMYGAGDKQGLKRAIHTSMLISVIAGAIVALLGELFSKKFLEWMNTPPDVIDGAVLYIKIYFLGMPAAFIYNFGAAILRAGGDTRRPLFILMFSGFVNVMLNLLFVIVFKMSVAGVAWATLDSQLISATLVLTVLLRTKTEFRLNLSELRIHKNDFVNISKIGIPSGLNGIMFNVSNIIIQTAMNQYGKVVIAGSTAMSNIEGIIAIGISAAEQACISFVSQNFGAGKLERVDRVAKCALIFSFLIAISMIAVVVPNGDFFMGLYTNDPLVVEAGKTRMYFVAALYFLLVPLQIFSGCFRGLGHSVEPTIINAFFVCVVRVIWIYTIYNMFPSVEMIYVSYPITWFASSIAMMMAYLYVRKRIFSEIRDRNNKQESY